MSARYSGRITAVVIATVLTLNGCPRRFDPAAAPALTSPDSSVNERFSRACKLYDQAKLDRADRTFADLLRDHPTDPLASAAKLYRGRIALDRGQPRVARNLLEPLAAGSGQDQVATRARYHLGLALARTGEFTRAGKLLRPFLQQVAAKDRPALLVALAHVARGLKDLTTAAVHLDELHRTTTRPVERLHARGVLAQVLDGLSPSQLREVHRRATAGSLLAALGGHRLARHEAAMGNAAEAARLLSSTADARERHGVVMPGQTTVNVGLVGVLVPLSGRYRSAGREVLRGAVEASGALGGSPKGRLAIAVRDSGRNPGGAARQLINDEGVVALVGTLDPTAAATVADVASKAGVPFVALSRLKSTRAAGHPTLQILPDNDKRADALARYAVQTGVRRLATLAPDSRYGRAMVAAFERSARAGGGQVVHKLVYSAGTRSFSKQAAQLSKTAPFDALFIPDRAHVLGLIAPALARAGLRSGRRPSKSGTRRTIQLLSTADGATPRLMAATRRYVQGATIAPGFYPDTAARVSGRLVRRFQTGQGQVPSLVAALAFDAVELVRVAGLGSRRIGRAALRSALLTGKGVQGLTGIIRFDGAGRRLDPPLLYRVKGDQIRLVDR